MAFQRLCRCLSRIHLWESYAFPLFGKALLFSIGPFKLFFLSGSEELPLLHKDYHQDRTHCHNQEPWNLKRQSAIQAKGYETLFKQCSLPRVSYQPSERVFMFAYLLS